MSAWTLVARISDLPEDAPFAAAADGVEVVVVHSSAGWRAFQGLCPHAGALLGEGELVADEIVCRNHRWRFGAEDGRRRGGEQCLLALPVKEEAGALYVDATGAVEAKAAGHRTLDDLPGPRGLPLIGSVLALRRDRMHEQLEAWARIHGPMYKVRFGPRTLVVVRDPEIIEQILRARPITFRRLGTVERTFDEMGVGGVFSAEGEAWRPQRRLAVGALSPRNLHGFYPTLRAVAERMLRRWERAAGEGRVFDPREDLRLFTVDVTTALAFGYDVNTIDAGPEALHRHLEVVFPALARRLTSIVPYWRYVRLPKDRELDAAIEAVRAWLEPVVARTRERLEAEPHRAKEPRNFLEAMLVARDSDGRPFSDDLVFGNAMTMLVAGEDTTASTLAWIIHHVCDAPSVAERLRAEADEVLGEGAPLPPDSSVTERMVWASAVANETMRLRPIAPILIAEANVPTVVGGVRIPPGTGTVSLTRMAAMDPANIDSPTEFLPGRWLDPDAVTELQRKGVHIPFGSGPRICPGRSLAMLKMRLVLSLLYGHFDVERVGESADVEETLTFTLIPRGLKVRLHRRT